MQTSENNSIAPQISLSIFFIAGVIELYYLLNDFLDTTNSIYMSILAFIISALTLIKYTDNFPLPVLFYPFLGALGFISLVYEKIGFVSIPLFFFLLILSYLPIFDNEQSESEELKNNIFIWSFVLAGLFSSYFVITEIITGMSTRFFYPYHIPNRDIEYISIFFTFYLIALFLLTREGIEYNITRKILYIPTLILSFFGASGIHSVLTRWGINSYLAILTIAPFYIYALFLLFIDISIDMSLRLKTLTSAIKILLLVIIGVMLISYSIPFVSEFFVKKPSVKLDDLKNDIMLGDNMTVTGTANNFNNQNLIIRLADNISQYYTENVVEVQNGKFNTKFDTTSFQSGLYNIVVRKDNDIMDIRTIRIVDSTIESIVIIPVSFTYGGSTKAVVALKNNEDKEKNLKINLILDGTLFQSKNVLIKPNSFVNVEFTIEKPSVGVHKVNVGGREASFRVLPAPYLRLDPINRKIGIGNSLTITGTSNEPDGTNVLLTIQSNSNILAQQNAEIKNGIYSAVFDTSNARENIYTITAKTPTEISDSIEVAFIKLLSTFEITDFSLSESTVIVGTPITATVTVKNTGNIAGSKELILYIDGFEKKRQTITVEPNEIKRATFSIEEGVGSHQVRVESYTKGFIIRPTPNIVLDSIKDTPIGDKFTVNGKTNMPDGTSILVTAKSESANLPQQIATSQEGRFSVTFDTNGANEGIYQVKAQSVSGTSSDIVSALFYRTVPEVSISLGLSQKEIIVGQSVKAMVTLTSTSEGSIDQTLELRVDGKLLDTKTVNVGALKTVEFTIPNPSIGTHIVDVNGYQTQFSVVSMPSTGDIGFQLRADKSIINMGEEDRLTLIATNVITKPIMTVQLILTIPTGMSITSTEFTQKGAGQYSSVVDVKPGDIGYIQATVKPNQAGSHKIDGRIVYYFNGNVTDQKDEIQTLYITVIQ